MSRQLANHLKSYGRDGDTELVHMTKGEIKGLQDLAMAHGGSLTINPDTGLAEAGFLKNILPMIAGAGLMMIPGVGPLAAAGMVGGFETLRTGDIGKGLMAGLGAYGGAGLAQGLAGAAGSAATNTSAANALGVPASAMPVNAATGLPTAVGTGATSQAGMLAAQNASMGLTPLQSAANISSSAGYAAGAAPASMSTQAANLMSAGAQSVAANPLTAGKTMYNAMPTGSVPALGATAANAMLPEYKSPVMPKLEEDDGGPNKGKYLSPNFQGYDPRRPNPYYRPTGLGYAAGGMIDPMQQMPNGGLAALQGMRDGYAAPQTMAGNIPQMAGGGEIGGYSDGGRMLKGPGDGMSDSIPGVIGNKQPARLADGEFVVPADVVSHLGNGSTDAGAKRLYAMMDNVRKARTGTKKQGKQIKAEKYLPVKKMADGGLTAAAPTAVSTAAPDFSSSSIVSPEALAGLADLSALGGMISNSRVPARMAPATAPTSAGTSAVDQIAATAAARPVSDPVTFNAGKTRGLFGGDYSNIRPDMLIDPSAAGWEMYSSSPRSNPYSMLTGEGGFIGNFSRRLNPAPEGSYTDSQGNVWVRSA